MDLIVVLLPMKMMIFKCYNVYLHLDIDSICFGGYFNIQKRASWIKALCISL